VHEYGGVVRADRPADLDAVLDALTAADDVELIVHAGTFGSAPALEPELRRPADEEARHALDVILGALQVQRHAVGANQRRRAVPVLVLTAGAVRVTPAEPSAPALAAVAAVVRSAVLEHGPGTARMLDAAGVPEQALAAEIAVPTHDDPVLALRGMEVWRPAKVRLAVSGWPASLLEPAGRYVITGGLGAVGLAVARGLAETGLQPRLVLLSRHADPDRLDPAVRRQLAGIEAVGGEVTVLAGDVADRAAMTALFARIAAEQGPVHGILHAAGVAGGALIVNRVRADASRVLRPKVAGSIVLRDIAVSTPSIRFLTLFSSRAALNGLIGSADYAAANAFMDALAADAPRNLRLTVVSVDWPTWHGMGMAAGTDRTVRWRTRIEPTDWVVAEHRLDGVPLLPASGVLDLLVRAVRESTSGDETVELADVTLIGPLTVERGTDVTVELVPARVGWTVTVRSWMGGEPQQRVRTHVTATASRPALPAPQRLDLAAEAADWAPVDPPRSLDSRFRFGPRFDVVTACRRGADPDTTIGVLELPERYDDDLVTHAVHPALLDRALALQQRPGDHIPFLYRRVVVHRDLPGQVIARLSLAPADSSDRVTVDAVLCDGLGRRLVEVEGLTKIHLAGRRPVDPAATGSGIPDAAAARPGEARIGLTTGVSEVDGVATLLRLLAPQTPPHVAVVPAQEWTDDRPVSTRATAPAARPPRAARAPQEPLDAPPPGTDLVHEIGKVWAETIGVADVDADSDFFEIGGDSLVAVQLVSRLQDRFGVPLRVSELFDAPTVGSLAGTIGAKLA
jgi:NADP-dependent 3-hydroxy acid dehydrogenase YdfG/acyl carrier protein